jgi:hypothetical protein
MTQKMENSTQSAINPNQAASNSTTFNPSSNIESSIKDELNTNNNSNNKSQAAALNQTPANASASKLMNIGGGSGGGGVANFQQQNPMMPQAGSYMNMNTFMDPYMFNPQSFTPQPQLTQTIIPNSKTIPSNLNSISASQTQKNNNNNNNNPTTTLMTNPMMMDFQQMQYQYQMMQMYQMAQMAAPYGYNMNPYMSQYPYGPFGMPMPPSSGPLPDDQQSMQSFAYFDDTRSVQKLNHRGTESLAGADLKSNLLLMKNTTTTNTNNTSHQNPAQNMPDSNSEPNHHQRAPASPQLVIKREENRMTPQLHPLPHVRACFSLNSLVQIRANDPCEGQPALVDIFSLTEIVDQYLINPNLTLSGQVKFSQDDDDDEFGGGGGANSNSMGSEMREKISSDYKLLQEFPGPLVREHTSKAQLIQFCQKNIRECLSNANVNLIDPQSHALLWDFLALLVRQNGIVDLKTDISSLLLSGIMDTQTLAATTTTTTTSNKPIIGNDDSSAASTEVPLKVSNSKSRFTPISFENEESHLNKLRQLLGAGQKADAIELAIKYNMWPHALFLASSSSSPSINNPTTTDEIEKQKSLNKVKNRFINSLQASDPIHTCYQLLVGRVPSVATNISKSEWSDWRRHLAMIVANVDNESNRGLVLSSIKTMGDTLASNGRVAASHFCYLLSDCLFGTFNRKSSKLVLIGSSHNQEFNKFCQINAIQATEIYEFANSLRTANAANGIDFLEHFVKYKLIYASKLLEYGFVSEAYKYLEVIAKAVNLNPQAHHDKLSSVFQLANRLRIYDSDFSIDDLSTQNSEPLWLQDLNNNYKKLHLNAIWHLLPSSAKVSPPLVSPKAQQQQNIATISVSATKLEPKSVNDSLLLQNEPSLIINSTDLLLPNKNRNGADLDDLNLDIKNINLNSTYNDNLNNIQNNNNNIAQMYTPQQSMPFNPTQQPIYDYPIDNVDTATAQQIAHRRYAVDDENAQNVQYQQQQHQYQPQQFSNNSTRKSSTSSNISSINNKGYPTARSQDTTNNKHQTNPYSRSRQNSASIMQPPLVTPSTFTPFNQYISHSQQQQQQPKIESTDVPPFFPQMQKSQTFPANNKINEEFNNEQDDDYASNNQTSQQQQQNEDENDDEFSTSNRKPNKKNQSGQVNSLNAGDKNDPQNKWWFKRAIDFIKPAAGPKKMVLPDDKKKSIVWDEKQKRFVNLDSTGSETIANVKPPPTFLPPTLPSSSSTQQQQSTLTSDQNTPMSMPTSNQFSNQSQLPNNNNNNTNNTIAAAPPVNRFSIKSQNSSMRNYYAKVDVLADQSKKKNVDQPLLAPMISNMPPPSQLPPRFFVPQADPNSSQQNQSVVNSQQFNNNVQSGDSVSQNQQEQHQNQQHQQYAQPQYQFQPQSNQIQQSQQEYYQPQYQNQNRNQDTDENDSAENTNESGDFNGSSSQSNESNSAYSHQQQQQHQQNLYYSQENQDQYFNHQHSNI